MARLKIAIPSKGALSAAATDILKESGYRQRTDAKELRLIDVDNDVEFFYLRPRDIALYVGEGTLDVGIPGAGPAGPGPAPRRGSKAGGGLPAGFRPHPLRFPGPPGEVRRPRAARGKA